MLAFIIPAGWRTKTQKTQREGEENMCIIYAESAPKTTHYDKWLINSECGNAAVWMKKITDKLS